MTVEPGIIRKERSHKSIIITVTLQCIPLVGASGCAAQGATHQDFGPALLFWLAIGFWGFGYLYLRRWTRFILSFLVGPLFAVSSCTASFEGVTYDYEHASYVHQSRDQVASADRASFQEALIISAAVLLLSVDAWRLAGLHNAELLSDTELPSRPPTAPPAPSAVEATAAPRQTDGQE